MTGTRGNTPGKEDNGRLAIIDRDRGKEEIPDYPGERRTGSDSRPSSFGLMQGAVPKLRLIMYIPLSF